MNPISRWFGNRSLAAQLYMGFSVAVTVAIVLLISFISTTPVVNELNASARQATTRLRQFYDLRDQAQNLQVWMVRYEVSVEDFELVQYTSQYSRLRQQIASLQNDASSSEAAHLSTADALLARLEGEFATLSQANVADDMPALQAAHEQASATLDALEQELTLLIIERQADLDELQARVDEFGLRLVLSILCTLPAFLLAGGIATLVVNNSLIKPFRVVTEAAHSFQQGAPDLEGMKRLAQRKDSIGEMASEFLEMAQSAAGQQETLRAETEEIRKKIR